MKIFEIVSKDLEIWKYSDLFVIELCLMFAWYLPRVELNNSPDSVSSFREKGWTEKPLSPFQQFLFGENRKSTLYSSKNALLYLLYFRPILSAADTVRRMAMFLWTHRGEKRVEKRSSRTDNSPRTYAMCVYTVNR